MFFLFIPPTLFFFPPPFFAITTTLPPIPPRIGLFSRIFFSRFLLVDPVCHLDHVRQFGDEVLQIDDVLLQPRNQSLETLELESADGPRWMCQRGSWVVGVGEQCRIPCSFRFHFFFFIIKSRDISRRAVPFLISIHLPRSSRECSSVRSSSAGVCARQGCKSVC